MGEMRNFLSLSVCYKKFNGNFKRHINFGRIKGGQGDDV